MKFAFYTLGCKVNQYETQAMEQLLTEKGHRVTAWDQPCDGYIINTCSVTAVADKKNRAIIRRCRREHPEAIIAVCGCHSQHDPEAIRALGVDLVGGSANRKAFVEQLILLAETLSPSLRGMPTGQGELTPSGTLCHLPQGGRQAFLQLDNALKRRSFETLPAGGLAGRTRAMLKVQDGCVNFCSYCIIPYTRGPVRSQTLENTLAEARKLAAEGYRELVVTGIEIASWGVDLPGKPSLIRLLDKLCGAVPGCRIRLGSLEPRIITEEFCCALKAHKNLCPHFHLSLQSGCDSVLMRMKRKYDTARFLESVKLLKTHFPGCAVTTDMIVAFPGETEEEFRQSLAFIQECGFGDMHIFPYSRRPGTPADKMPGQHCNATKEARSREAIAVAEKMALSYREALVGTVQEVLFEEPEGAYFTGHAPNYVKVYAEGADLHNQVKSVTLTAPYRDGMLGVVAK